MTDLRYQHAPWYIRLWRRLKYQPLSYLMFCWWAIQWSNLNGHPDWDRLSIPDLWSLKTGWWHAKANWLYDWSEVKADLTARYILGEKEVKSFKDIDSLIEDLQDDIEP